MTYRIEITADSLTELSGKVLALAAQLQTVPRGSDALRAAADEVAPVGEKPKRKSKAEDKPVEAKAEDKPVEVKAEDAPAPEQKAIDFDKDITPKVLKVVEKLGRSGIEGVLGQFGVVKASQVPVDQRGELLAALEAALAETE